MSRADWLANGSDKDEYSLSALKMFTGVHAQASSTTTESVALRSVLAGVACFAEKFTFVLGAVG